MTVEEAHGISQRLETRLDDELGIAATVHVEPREKAPSAADSRTDGPRTAARTGPKPS